MEFVNSVFQLTLSSWEVILIAAFYLALALQSQSQNKPASTTAALYFLGALTLLLAPGVLLWIDGLGADSYLEASDFAWSEAVAWIRAFVTYLPEMLTSTRRLLLYASEAILV